VSHKTVGAPLALVRTGRLLLVAEGEGGLSLVDVGVPRSPRTLARLSLAGEPNALALDGRWVYVASGTAISAVDISEPSRPAATWTMRFDGNGERLALAERTVYVALGEGGVVLADVGNAAQAAVSERIETGARARSVRVANGIAVVGTERGIDVWDVRGRPRLVSSFERSGGVSDVVLSEDGRIAYLAAGGVEVVDVASGRLLGRWLGIAFPSALALGGNRLAVAALEEGVVVLDVSNPASPVETRRFPTDGSARTVCYDGETLFAGAGSTLLVFDGTREVGRWDAGFDVRSLAARGGFLFACGETTLAGWDARDVARPTLLSRVRGLDWAEGIALLGDKVVVSDRFGLRLYRRTDAGAPLAVRDEIPNLPEGTETFLSPFRNRLGQNYPNPFNPETWIPYQLAEASPVTVRIYDATGRLVRELDLGVQEAGGHVTRDRAAYWDGRNELGETVASGVYYYEFRAGEYVKTQRMLILK
jgi:hypothetical protein